VVEIVDRAPVFGFPEEHQAARKMGLPDEIGGGQAYLRLSAADRRRPVRARAFLE